jgi:hypothetical protein
MNQIFFQSFFFDLTGRFSGRANKQDDPDSYTDPGCRSADARLHQPGPEEERTPAMITTSPPIPIL